VLVGLVTDSEGLVPGPGVLNEGLVLLVVDVELLERVRLPVRGDVESVLELVSLNDESTRDDRVVRLSVNAAELLAPI
jgi:hypothetical protein